MSLSDFSLSRPVLIKVSSALILIFGTIAISQLPIRQYPSIVAPELTISTIYQGASPHTIEQEVTFPLERAINKVPNVKSFKSQSTFGMSQIDIQFSRNTNLQSAISDVTNAINIERPELPSSPNFTQPVVNKVKPTEQPILWLVLQSDHRSIEELSEIFEAKVLHAIQGINGVGQVEVVGERKPAIRVWLDPNRMHAYGVSSQEIVEKIRENNFQLPAGQITANAVYFNVDLTANLRTPNAIRNLVLRNAGGKNIKIGDVATVRYGAQNYDTIARFNGKKAIGIGIVPVAQANALQVSKSVGATLPLIQAAIPKETTLKVGIDTTEFVSRSLLEVGKTIFIAFFIVAIIIYFFMGTFRAALIPIASIPVSIVGSFGALWLLDYSINTLTLFALVLAIGIVVDDSIIVLESVFQFLESGLKPLDAARKGAHDITSPVIATTISLAAIFAPIMLVRGDAGLLFREFAVTLVVTVMLSGLVALTLTPVLSAQILKRNEHLKYKSSWGENLFARFVSAVSNLLIPIRGRLPKNYLFDRMTESASRQKGFRDFLKKIRRQMIYLSEWLCINKSISIGAIVASLLISTCLFWFLPTSFIPPEDQSLIAIIVHAPEGRNILSTDSSIVAVDDILSKSHIVDSYFTVSGLSLDGPDLPNMGFAYAQLKRQDERNISQFDIVKQLRREVSHISSANVVVVNPPSLSGNDTSRDVNFVVSGSDFSVLDNLNQSIEKIFSKDSNLLDFQSDLSSMTPQISISIDQAKAENLGIAVADIARELEIGLGGEDITNYITGEDRHPIVAQLSPEYRSEPKKLQELAVASRSGSMVPLSLLTHSTFSSGADQISHLDAKRSFEVGANLQPGKSLTAELSDISSKLELILPVGYSIGLTGSTKDFDETMSSIYALFILSIIFIYLVLAAQFENWVHPITVLLSLPFAISGALFLIWVSGNTINLYSGIGILLLTGLVAKNGILLIDYANRQVASGTSLINAAVAAVTIRFRPVVMTSLAIVASTLPLALATGPGAESRRPLGWAIVGGVVFGTFFALVITPSIYVLIDSVSRSFSKMSDDRHLDGEVT
ncbi:MAG: efflux RND transporter permease subunit [Parvibaculaceae bacterium]